MCPVYLHPDDFPQTSGSVPVGAGLKCFYDGSALTVVADYELAALSQFLDSSKTAIKDLYLSPVIVVLEWEVVEGVIRIIKAAVPRIMVRTKGYYTDAKKAEMLPVEALAL